MKIPSNRRGLICAANITHRAMVERGGAPAVNVMRPVDRWPMVSLFQWVNYGMQSVHMPATFEAALMATTYEHVLDDLELPWPAFEIQLGAGLVRSTTGTVYSVIVSAIPSDVIIVGPYAYRNRFTVCQYDEGGICTSAPHKQLSELLDPENHNPSRSGPYMADAFPWEIAAYSQDVDTRVGTLVARVIAGTILTINNARREHRDAYGSRQPKLSHGDMLQPRSVKLGRPLEIDCREPVRAFMAGDRRNAPSVRHLRRGHWRHQPHGPRHELKRLQWIQPCWVNADSETLLVRPTHIGGTP